MSTVKSARSKNFLALSKYKSALLTIIWISALLNIMLLAGPIYMMLIYDSVMPSGSKETLLSLFLMVVVVYIFQGLFDYARGRLLAEIAAGFEDDMADRVQALTQDLRREGKGGPKMAFHPMQDLDYIHDFLASPGPASLVDLPWTILFLALLTVLHPWLGLAGLVGVVVLAGLTYLSSLLGAEPSLQMAHLRSVRSRTAQENGQAIELIRAMGMGDRMRDRWRAANSGYRQAQHHFNRIAGTFGGIGRLVRLLFQAVVLTIGALLFLRGEASGGIVFAASIVAARAMGPLDQAISHWASFQLARQAWARLDELSSLVPDILTTAPETDLPIPNKSLQVTNLVVVPPTSDQYCINDLTFHLVAGDALGVIGPSASGKTCLARALVGAWPAAAGTIRLDGAALDQWGSRALGKYLGYLPQHIDFLHGTIAENIARFDPERTSESVVAAALVAGAHETIVQFENGYQQLVGSSNEQISAGQRQRIALARALYGNPFLLVLDEPNSNLDVRGELALNAAIESVRNRGGIVVVMAHRASVLQKTNKILVLQSGTAKLFGDSGAVLKQLGMQLPTVAKPTPTTAAIHPGSAL